MHMRFEQWLHAPATAFGKSIADRQRHLRCFLPAYHCPARQIFRAEYQAGKYFWRYLSGIPISAPSSSKQCRAQNAFCFRLIPLQTRAAGKSHPEHLSALPKFRPVSP